MGEENHAIELPIIDISSPDRLSTATSIRQACIEFGFFYVVNHGVDRDLLARVLDESRKFFSLPLEDKMKLSRKHHRAFSTLYAEKIDPTLGKGDPNETFYIGPLDDKVCHLNQWPSEGVLPNWRPTMEKYHGEVLSAAKNLQSLIALALNLDEMFFQNIGAPDSPNGFLGLLHYPGDLSCSGEEVLGSSAHSDYGMITVLATDGVPGLQVCRKQDSQPRIWEDVRPIEGALIVNIGDMTERWTNGLFRSTLHRVVLKGKTRFSAAFFFDPPEDVVVECIESCCSETNPPRFPPIRVADYYNERFKISYGS